MRNSVIGSHLVSDSLKRDLSKRYGKAVRFNVSLAEISRWRIGGLADAVITPRNVEELAELRAWLYSNNLPSVVIGATSNLLFADEGLRAIAIQIGGSCLSNILIEDRRVIAQSGIWVPGLARKVMRAGLSGLEHACGIPGTLGGLVYMNGGSQRKGIGDHIEYVGSIDEQGRTTVRSFRQCEFAYRSSIFQRLNEVIVDVGLVLDRADDKREVRSNMLKIMRGRRKKFPQKLPNCGSVFVSNPSMYEMVGPPGRAIEGCELKGLSYGKAQVSNMHANFIVNNGDAKAGDVLYLIRMIGKKVMEKTGFIMEVEAKFVSPEGEIQNITFE